VNSLSVKKDEFLKKGAAVFAGLVLLAIVTPERAAAVSPATEEGGAAAARSQSWQYIDQRARAAGEAKVRVLAVQPERGKTSPVQEKTIAPAPRAAVVPADLFRDVFFAVNSHAIDSRQQEQLRRMASWLRENRAGRLTVVGHGDDRGSRAYNLALGNRRAAAVKDYLVRSGAAPEGITTLSQGKDKPFDRRRTRAARASNRRVHFVFTPATGAEEGVNGGAAK